MRRIFIDLVYFIASRFTRFLVIAFCPIFKTNIVIMDGTRIYPLWMVPEYLLRRSHLTPDKPSKKTILLMSSAANLAALKIIRRYFPAYELGNRLYAMVSNAFPATSNFVSVERVLTKNFSDVFHSTPPQMALPHEVESLGKTYLQAQGIGPDDWYVCFVNRDNSYLANTYPERDWAYHDYRNSSISNYIPAMEYVVKQGGWSIRVGSLVKEPLPTDLDNHIIDYAVKHRTEELDLFLISRCRLFVSGNTGLSAIATAFDRPCAVVNLIPLSHNDPFRNIDRFIPKSLMTSDDKILTFDEMREIGMFEKNIGAGFMDFYVKKGISPIENSPDDIKALVKEMLEFQNPNAGKRNIYSDVQSAFKKRYFAVKGDWENETDISASFLKRHPELLPDDFQKLTN
jgi:putative glycosyltransferase (TIGR04372 family)